MNGLAKIAVCPLILSALVSPVRAAPPADDFKAALASAEAANGKAGELKNQWTTTGAALSAAKKAADGGNYANGIQLAIEAEALAKASIAQVERERTLWKESELH